MANIEVHGGSIKGLGQLQLLISKKFDEAGLGKATVITEIRSYPAYCDEKHSVGPFLRIWGETAQEINQVIIILRGLGVTKQFDIETVFVNSFIPKEEKFDSSVCPYCFGRRIGDYPFTCDYCGGSGVRS